MCVANVVCVTDRCVDGVVGVVCVDHIGGVGDIGVVGVVFGVVSWYVYMCCVVIVGVGVVYVVVCGVAGGIAVCW